MLLLLGCGLAALRLCGFMMMGLHPVEPALLHCEWSREAHSRAAGEDSTGRPGEWAARVLHRNEHRARGGMCASQIPCRGTIPGLQTRAPGSESGAGAVVFGRCDSPDAQLDYMSGNSPGVAPRQGSYSPELGMLVQPFTRIIAVIAMEVAMAPKHALPALDSEYLVRSVAGTGFCKRFSLFISSFHRPLECPVSLPAHSFGQWGMAAFGPNHSSSLDSNWA